MAEKVTMKDGSLIVPNKPIIPYIQGDGIGVDIWHVAQKVIDSAVLKAYGDNKSIEWKKVLAGQEAFDQTSEWLPSETLDAFKEYLIGIKGPLTTPVGGGIRSLNVALRQELDLYACVRPVQYFPGTPSPVKEPELVSMTIFRENTEDIYAGIEWMEGTPECDKVKNFLTDTMQVTQIRFPKTSSIGIKPVSVEGTQRLVRSAIDYALRKKHKSVTLVHKGNIMKFTEGGFKKWGYDVAEQEYSELVFTWRQYDEIKAADGEDAANQAQDKAIADGKIIIKDVIADNFLQQILLRPEEYDTIATLNLNGDYISDALAAMVGGIGIAPGANINYNTGRAIFEATHGTAPKYAGKNKVNPSSVILSAVMMLDYMGWTEAGDLIEKGVAGAIASKNVTYDFAREVDGATELSTSDFGDEIIKHM